MLMAHLGSFLARRANSVALMQSESSRTYWKPRFVFVLAEIVIVVIGGLAGAQIYKHFLNREVVTSALGCVNTLVTVSQQPTGPAMAQGGAITFLDDIAPSHGIAGQQIRGVYVQPGSYAVASAGDSVRVCLLSIPESLAPPGGGPGCDPNVDIRGRTFLVFDRSNKSAQVYSNGEHGCGGA
jgi:hypothetical protein